MRPYIYYEFFEYYFIIHLPMDYAFDNVTYDHFIKQLLLGDKKILDKEKLE
jgi:hypothetical protein